MDLKESLSRKGDWAGDWKFVLACSLLVYAFAFYVRIGDYAYWNHPALRIGPEFIMGTHDAYFWLAGAEGVGNAVGQPMSTLAAFLSKTLGLTLGQVGFWTPAIVCSLASVVVYLFGWLLAGWQAGLFAGMVGGLTWGFYTRTRLGYYDTDIVTLLFPLITAFGLTCLLSPHMRGTWLPKARDPMDAEPVARHQGWYALGLGIFCQFASLWHADIGLYNKLALVLAIILALLATKPGHGRRCLNLLAVFAPAAFLGWIGIGLGAVYSALLQVRPRQLDAYLRTVWPAIVLLAAVALAGDILWGPGQVMLYKITAYSKPVAESATQADTPIYPAIAQSVREAQNLPWRDVLMRIGPNPTVGLIGVAGFAAALFFRPTLLFLLPLLVLSLGSVHFGARMSMFGGPAVALGVALPLHWLARSLFPAGKARPWILAGLQVGVALAAFLPLWRGIYMRMGPTPVLTKPHAQALIALKDIAPENSQVWTWWDYGYATQYYARRMTPSDGGRHAGRNIFPTAVALAGHSLLETNQIIRMSAAYGGDPTTAWDKDPAKKVQGFLDTLDKRVYRIPATPPQYLVLCWANLGLAYWISYYGTWNLITGNGVHGTVMALDRAFNINFDTGQVSMDGVEGAIPLNTIDMLKPEGLEHKQYAFPDNHLLTNLSQNSAFLLDNLVYKSSMVQLLLVDPSNPGVKQLFKLVYEGFPNVRVFEVMPINIPQPAAQ